MLLSAGIEASSPKQRLRNGDDSTVVDEARDEIDTSNFFIKMRWRTHLEPFIEWWPRQSLIQRRLVLNILGTAYDLGMDTWYNLKSIISISMILYSTVSPGNEFQSQDPGY